MRIVAVTRITLVSGLGSGDASSVEEIASHWPENEQGMLEVAEVAKPPRDESREENQSILYSSELGVAGKRST